MHPEVVITFFMVVVVPVFAYAAYVRLVTVRRLRKTVDRLLEQVTARGAAAAAPAAPETDEMRKINQRLQVLERIAVEKEATLAREIEELRVSG